MQKILSIILSIVMIVGLSTVAMAYDAPIYGDTYAPGSKVWVDETYFVDENGNSLTLVDSGSGYIVTSDFEVGGALIGTIKVDVDNSGISMTLKENYTIEDQKTIEGEISVKDKDTDIMYTADISEFGFEIDVANEVEYLDLNRIDSIEEYDIAENTIYLTDGEFGWAKFNLSNRLITVTVDMNKNEKVFMEVNEDSSEIEYNLGVNCDVYNFVGRPVFDNKATVEVELYDGQIVFEYVDGELVVVDGKLDNGVFTFETNSLGLYVVSDEIEGTVNPVEPETDKNPNTGTNDVVGVATALSVLSLIAMGAVSLKKSK